MRELHLFAGAGGGILGGHLLGHTTVAAVEIEPYCQSVLKQRQADGILPGFPIFGDIRNFNGIEWRGKVDVIAGGFPCTDISVAGGGLESKEINQDCGPRWQGSFARFNQQSESSWKTRQHSLFGGLEEFSGTWPQWGMMLNGECWGLTSPVTITEENESGLLPTPIATDWKGGTTSRRKDNGRERFDQWRDYVKLKFGMTYPHPTHSEVRMGFPEGWSELAPLGMPRFLKWQQQCGGF
jgi:DNA (cytosine-5)-methyltransferase 1